MWTALFPNWKNFRVYPFKEEAKAILDQLNCHPFLLKCTKTSKSHRNFLLFFSPSNPSLFLKLFIPRPLKKNRVKAYLKTLLRLKKLEVPLIEPLFLFWENPCFSLFRDNPFYGGIVFPYFNEGFLNPGLAKVILPRLVSFLFLLHEKGVYLRDTKFNNFYYEGSSGFKIFDLDGIKIYQPPLSKKERLKDLATLAMTLEWEGLTLARRVIWDEYARLFPELNKKDYTVLEYYIHYRKKKRVTHLGRSNKFHL